MYMQNHGILLSLSSIFTFYLKVSVILQGSAATYLRCGEICYLAAVENFFFFHRVKEFDKSVKI